MPPGVKRSRVLWDEARKEDARWTATARAILYELQPIRLSTIDVSGVVSTVTRFCLFVVALTSSVARSLPGLTRELIRMLRGMSSRQWGMVAIVVGYYYFVRLVHRYLDAGPLVIIATGMVVIFTIGLGDGGSAGMSAYSVFNRGFQQLLGSVDVEALVQQYAGGGLAVQAQMNANRDQGMNEHNAARAGGGGENNRPAAAAAAAADANEDEDADAADVNEPPQDGRNRARRSNKKSRNKDRRERNANVRREMERQRQAAAAMGFVGEGEQDIAAMNRLIEEQVLADHRHEED